VTGPGSWVRPGGNHPRGVEASLARVGGLGGPLTSRGVEVEALSRYGGTVLKTSLAKEGEKELQEALHGGAQ
jgi:hypothetical protein